MAPVAGLPGSPAFCILSHSSLIHNFRFLWVLLIHHGGLSVSLLLQSEHSDASSTVGFFHFKEIKETCV